MACAAPPGRPIVGLNRVVEVGVPIMVKTSSVRAVAMELARRRDASASPEVRAAWESAHDMLIGILPEPAMGLGTYMRRRVQALEASLRAAEAGIVTLPPGDALDACQWVARRARVTLDVAPVTMDALRAWERDVAQEKWEARAKGRERLADLLTAAAGGYLSVPLRVEMEKGTGVAIG